MKYILPSQYMRIPFVLFFILFCIYAGQIFAQAPGGVQSGLSLWLKSDSGVFQNAAGTIPASSDAPVLSWRNQVNSELLLTDQSIDSPIFIQNPFDHINFNPYIYFNSSVMTGLSAFNARTVFIVSEPNTHIDQAPIFSNRCTPEPCSDNNIRVELFAGWQCCDTDDFANNGTFQTIGNGADGNTGFQFAHILYAESETLVSMQDFQIGDPHVYPAPAESRTFSGKVSEIIAFDRVLSAEEKAQVLSYLALKYGINPSQRDLVNSNGDLIWDQSSSIDFNNDVAGIGRDDNLSLSQKQTTSYQSDHLTVYIGALEETNQQNNAPIADQSFLIWGHNEESIYDEILLDDPIGTVTSRSAKVYLFRSTNFTESTFLRFSGFDGGFCHENIRLLVSETSDFASALSYENVSPDNFRLIFNPDQIQDGYFVTLGFSNLPLAPVVGGDLMICQGESTELSIISGDLSTADDWFWYTDSCGGINMGSGIEITVSPEATTTYYVRGEGGCGNGFCASVTVTVNLPSAITISGTTELCEGQDLELFGPDGAMSYSWSGPDDFESDLQNVLISNIPIVNQGEYSLSIVDQNGCTATNSLTVVIDELPISDAGADRYLCKFNSVGLEAFASPEGNGIWSIISGIGDIDDINNPFSIVSDIPTPSVLVLAWTVQSSNGFCEIIDSVQLTTELPLPAEAGEDLNVCDGISVINLSAILPDGLDGFWSIISGNATFSNIEDPNAMLSDLEFNAEGFIHLIWAIRSTCTVSDEYEFDDLYIYSIPAPGPAEIYEDTIEICDETETQLSANEVYSGTGEWSIFSGPGTIENPAAASTLITDLLAGETTIVVWTVTNEPCPDATDTIAIINNLPPEPVDAGPDQYLCEGTTSTVMAATPLMNATGQWFIESGSGTFSDVNDPNAILTDIDPGPGDGMIVYWFSDVFCPGSDIPTSDIMMIYFEPPSGPATILNEDFEICNQTEYSLQADLIYEGTGLWTVISGPGTMADPGLNNTTIEGLIPGQNTVVVWSVINEPCPPAADTLTIINAAPPETVNAGPDQYICEGTTSTMLNALPLIESEGEWTIVDGNGTISNINDPNATLSNMMPTENGHILLLWQTNAFCPGDETPAFDQMYIYFDQMPDEPNILIQDTTICNANSLPLIAATPQIGSGLWSIQSGPGNLILPNNPASIINNIVPGINNTVRWTVSNGVCPELFAEITITNTTYTPGAQAGPDQSICENEAVIILTAQTPVTGMGEWNIVQGSGTILQPNSPNTSLINFQASSNQTIVMTWTIYGDVCHDGNASGVDTILTYVSPIPGPADILNNDTVLCNQTSLTLEANPIFNGNGIWRIESGPGSISGQFSSVASINGLIPGQQTIVAWTVRAEGCPPASEQIIIQNMIISPPAEAGPTLQFCGIPESIALQASTPAVGSGTWTVISGQATINDVHSPLAILTNLSPNAEGNIELEWQISGDICLEEVGLHKDITIFSFYDSPGPALILSGDTSVCAIQNLELQAFPDFIGTGLWSVSGGPGTLLDPSSVSTAITGLEPGMSTVITWTVSNGVCPQVSEQITITNTIQTPSANAGPDQTICINQNSIQLNASQPMAGNGSWNMISGGAGFSSLSSANAVLAPYIPNASGQLVLTWTIQNDICHTSAETAVDTLIIQVDQLPSTANILTSVSELCSLNDFNIIAQIPAVGSGLWSVSAGPGSIVDVAEPTTLVSGLVPGQNTTLVWSVSNGVCPVSTDQLVLSNFVSFTPDAGPDQLLCGESSAQLIANDIPDAYWQIISGTANINNPANPTAFLNGLMPGNSYTLTWNIQSQACPLFSDTLVVEVIPIPDPAFAGENQTVCYENSANLQAGGGEGIWTLISGFGNIAAPNSISSDVSDLAYGINQFTWSLDYDGLCPQSIDTVEIFVVQMPDTPDAGPDQTICNTNSATLNAVPVIGGYWTIIEGPGIILDVHDQNTLILDLVPGQVTVLRWNVGGDVCPAISDEVILNILPGAEFTNAGADQHQCFQNQTFLSAQPSGGYWSVIQGAATFEDISNPNTAVTNLSSGTNILQWNVSFDGLCPLSTDQMEIEFTPLPEIFSAGNDITVCEQNSAQLHATSSVAGFWSVFSGQANVTEPQSPHSQITNLLPDQQILLSWNSQIPGCPLLSDTVFVQTYSAPVADAGQDVQQCYLTEILINASPSNGIWSIIQGDGAIAQNTSPNAQISDLSPGTNQIVWTAQYANGCPSTLDTLTIVLTPAPDAPEAGADLIICSVTETTLQASELTPPTMGFWTLVSGPGSIENPGNSNSFISGLTQGTSTILAWNVYNGNCPLISDTMTIQVLNNPPDANAGTDQSLCEEFITLLDAELPAGTGSWTLISGTGSISEPDNPASSISNLSPGENIFNWTYSAGNNCPEQSDEVSIFVYLLPDDANAGNDFQICGNQMLQLTANSPAIGQGTWNLINGTGLINEINNPNSTISGFSGESSIVLSWNISNGICPLNSDTLQIQIDGLPSTAIAGDNQRWCDINSALLQANTPATGQGTWSLISGSGNILNSQSPITNLQDLAFGSSTLSWTVSNGICPSSVDTIVIIVDEPPTASVSIDNIQACNVAEIILPANPVTIGNGEWQIVSGSGNFTQINQHNTNFSGFTPDQNTILRWIVSNGVCPSDTSIVSILVNALPSPADAGEDEIACQSELELMANTPSIGLGIWTLLSGNATLSNTNILNPVLGNLNINQSVTLAWTISNGICPANVDTIIIEAHSVFLNAETGPDIALCSANQALLQASEIPSGAMGLWTIISGPGIIQQSQDAQTIIEQLIPDQNTSLQWSLSDGTCTAFSDTLHIVNTDGDSISANFLVNELACTGDSLFLIDISDIPLNAAVSYSWDFGNNISGTVRDPILVYMEAGIYNISMTLSLGACISTSPVKTVEVTLCRPEEESNTDRYNFAKLYPTVNNGTFTIELEHADKESTTRMEIFNINGQLIHYQNFQGKFTFKEEVELPQAGIYIIKITNGTYNKAFRMVVR